MVLLLTVSLVRSKDPCNRYVDSLKATEIVCQEGTCNKLVVMPCPDCFVLLDSESTIYNHFINETYICHAVKILRVSHWRLHKLRCLKRNGTRMGGHKS